jgi:hypothetical protein
MLVDLGFLTVERVMITTSFDEEYRDRMLQASLTPAKEQEQHISLYTVVKECIHYRDLIRPFVVDNSYGQDIAENISIVSSIFPE